MSGAQVVVASHVASRLAAPAGTSAFGTQRPSVQPGMPEQVGKVLVSTTGAEGCTHAGPPSPPSGELPPLEGPPPVVPPKPPLVPKPPVPTKPPLPTKPPVVR